MRQNYQSFKKNEYIFKSYIMYMWLFLPVDNNRNWECKDEYSEESTEASNNLNNEGKKLVKVREAT